MQNLFGSFCKSISESDQEMSQLNTADQHRDHEEETQNNYVYSHMTP